MEKNPKISVIIPVYNVEKYLNQCVDSILNQEYKDIEVLLVDDGSPDNSGKICDEYASKDERVRVFHKKNGGLSDARNYGLKNAIGEYILFVDSDDFIEKESLQKIVSTCMNANFDVVFLKGYKFFEDEQEVTELDVNFDFSGDKEMVLRNISMLNKFPGSACTKMFRRSFLIDNNLFFEKGLLSEDIEWMIRVLEKANTITYSNEPYYYYRQNRNNSISNSISARSINSLAKIISMHAKLEPKDAVEECINNFLAYEYIILLANYSSLNEEEKNKVTEAVYKFAWILRYNNNLKVKLAYYLKNIVGVKFLAKALFIMLKYKKQNNK